MSSGPGKTQALILTHLSATPILFNKLLWNLAHAQNGISCQGKYGFLRAGRISRSFEESFRRAVRGLHENELITVTKRKFNDLDEAIDCLPYVTSNLQLHELRMGVKAEILDYLLTGGAKDVDVDFESYTVAKIKKGDPSAFFELEKEWEDIEQGVIFRLSQNSTCLDEWLNVLVRGRSLFAKRKLDFKKPLYALHASLKAHDESECSLEILSKILVLLERISSYESWRMGAIKQDLYKALKANVVTDELKHYLFKKHGDDFVSLPKHKEPLKKGGFSALSFNRKYDPILNKLVDRQLLKNHSYLSLP